MRYITGQQVYDEYGIKPEQLAELVLKGKIKCYNSDHKEILDVSRLEEIKYPCYSLNQNLLVINFPTKIQYCFIELPINKDLSTRYKELTNLENITYQTKEGDNDQILPILNYKLACVSKDNNEADSEKCTSMEIIDKGIYWCWNDFLFQLNLDKENFLNLYSLLNKKDFLFLYRVNWLLKNNQSINQSTLKFIYNFYEINRELEKEINKIEHKIGKCIRDMKDKQDASLYSEIEFDNQELYNNIKIIIDDFLKNSSNSGDFFDFLNKKFDAFLIDLTNYIYKQKDKMIDFQYIQAVFLKEFNFVNLVTIFIDEFNSKYYQDKNNLEAPFFIEYAKDQSNLLEKEGILNRKSEKYELHVDGKKFYIQHDNKIIACNESPLRKLDDDFIIEFNNYRDTLKNQVGKSDCKEYVPFGDKKIINIEQKRAQLSCLFEERERFQKVFRYNYTDKIYKKDYYYFDINEFLKFYPQEFHNDVKKVIYYNNIKSFLFDQEKICDYKYKYNKLKKYTIQLNNYNGEFLQKFYARCYEIFNEHCSDLELISNLCFEDKQNISEKEIKEFLCIFFIYYYKLPITKKESKKNNAEEIFNELNRLGLATTKNKNGFISRKNIGPFIPNISERNKSETEKRLYTNMNQEKIDRIKRYEKYDVYFPFIGFQDIKNCEKSKDYSLINNKILTYSNLLDKLKIKSQKSIAG